MPLPFKPGTFVILALWDHAPFEARARQAKVVVVEGNHHLHVEQPAALAQEILSLCKSSTD